MAIVNLLATGYSTGAPVATHGIADNVKHVGRTVEVGAADSNGSLYTMFRLPTNAMILGPSTLYRDDLASVGAPTLDIGAYPVDGNITASATTFNDGIDAATAGSGGMVKDIANYGKRIWELHGLSADPGGFVDVKVALLDADVNVGGTVTLSCFYKL